MTKFKKMFVNANNNNKLFIFKIKNMTSKNLYAGSLGGA